MPADEKKASAPAAAAAKAAAPAAAPAVMLRITAPFTQAGVTYAVGQSLDPEVTKRWPDGTLARRLSNGFVEWSV